jgi:hypothetical protein
MDEGNAVKLSSQSKEKAEEIARLQLLLTHQMLHLEQLLRPEDRDVVSRSPEYIVE